MVDTSQLRDALEKTGMEPDRAAALAPELARHLATAGADACTGDRAGGKRNVHRVEPGPELDLPYASVRSWFRHMPYASLRDYWENMPATAPMLLGTLFAVIYVSALLVRRVWLY